MAQTFVVDYLEEVGVGVVHLSGAPPGPAGAARVQVADGLTCWFDPTRPPSLTDCWVDLEAVDDDWLLQAFGPGAVALRSPGGVAEFESDGSELAWTGIAARLAMLEQARVTPLGVERPPLWALEAIVLRDALASVGMTAEGRFEVELELALPWLARLDPAVLDSVPMIAQAVAIIVDRVGTFHSALDRIEHLADELEVIADRNLDRLTEDLRPAPSPTIRILMSDPGVAGHDQLWSYLPGRFFPAGLFASMALIESTQEGFDVRLRISIKRPGGPELAVFTRLVDIGGDQPRILAIDSLLAEGDWYVTSMDVPAGFDFDRIRVEVVADLEAPVLSAKVYAKTLGAQWALLALHADRCGDRSTAVRYWHLSQHLHLAADEPALAEAAGTLAQEATDEPRSEPFLAESEQAAVVDDDTDPRDDEERNR